MAEMRSIIACRKINRITHEDMAELLEERLGVRLTQEQLAEYLAQVLN